MFSFFHVESKPAELANLLSHIRRGGGDQFGADGMAVRGHIGDHLSEIGDVGEHDCVGDQAGIFQLFFLLHRIAALDYRAAEADPVEDAICGFRATVEAHSSRQVGQGPEKVGADLPRGKVGFEVQTQDFT